MPEFDEGVEGVRIDMYIDMWIHQYIQRDVCV